MEGVCRQSNECMNIGSAGCSWKDEEYINATKFIAAGALESRPL